MAEKNFCEGWREGNTYLIYEVKGMHEQLSWYDLNGKQIGQVGLTSSKYSHMWNRNGKNITQRVNELTAWSALSKTVSKSIGRGVA